MYRFPVLFEAIAAGNSDVAMFLLECKADPGRRDSEGGICLRAACARGMHGRCVKLPICCL